MRSAVLLVLLWQNLCFLVFCFLIQEKSNRSKEHWTLSMPFYFFTVCAHEFKDACDARASGDTQWCGEACCLSAEQFSASVHHASGAGCW